MSRNTTLGMAEEKDHCSVLYCTSVVMLSPTCRWYWWRCQDTYIRTPRLSHVTPDKHLGFLHSLILDLNLDINLGLNLNLHVVTSPHWTELWCNVRGKRLVIQNYVLCWLCTSELFTKDMFFFPRAVTISPYFKEHRQRSAVRGITLPTVYLKKRSSYIYWKVKMKGCKIWKTGWPGLLTCTKNIKISVAPNRVLCHWPTDWSCLIATADVPWWKLPFCFVLFCYCWELKLHIIRESIKELLPTLNWWSLYYSLWTSWRTWANKYRTIFIPWLPNANFRSSGGCVHLQRTGLLPQHLWVFLLKRVISVLHFRCSPMPMYILHPINTTWILANVSLDILHSRALAHAHINAHISRYPITGLDKPLRLQEVEAPRTFRQSAREGGKIVSPTHRPPLSPVPLLVHKLHM
jgi:hypothetical protein